MNRKLINNIALFIALLFHVSGLIGILFTPYKNWFIQNTPVNLLVMAALLIITQTQKNTYFFFFAIVTAITGFVVEYTGVHTSLLFGNYRYGNVLGYTLFKVPLLIAVNWFIVIYCAGVATSAYENRVLKRLHAKGLAVNVRVQKISFVIDAALVAVLFDWILEPVAVKLGFWKWQSDKIPYYNYVCWFIVSALLLALFQRLPFKKQNIFAVHLLMIEVLFFLLLRTFL